MSCPKADLYQTGIVSPAIGTPVRIAKAPGGAMKVLEIAIQNQTPGVPSGGATFPPEFSATVQFFLGLPTGQAGSAQGYPISLQVVVQQLQLWSKPGVEADDDIYMVVSATDSIPSTPVIAFECRYIPEGS
jgi:hypothetical protein